VNVRPAREDDLPEVLAMLREDEEVITGRPSRLGEGDLLQWLTGVELESDTSVHEEDGRIVAFGWTDVYGERGFAIGAVHPSSKGRGHGSRLVDDAEARLAGRDIRRIQAPVLAGDAAAPGLFEPRGYAEVRRFYEMAIELDGATAVPALPDGLVLEQVGDVRALHAALDEGFRDHWEHQSRTFEEWWERRSEVPDRDQTLWFWVRDGDEIAAGIENYPNRNGGGYVNALATRPAWRGRGLAKALLLHAFAEFHRRGTTRVTLGVDAQNTTGATALYESVGMEPEMEQVMYEKPVA
jgi:mycothiol synthase